MIGFRYFFYFEKLILSLSFIKLMIQISNEPSYSNKKHFKLPGHLPSNLSFRKTEVFHTFQAFTFFTFPCIKNKY